MVRDELAATAARLAEGGVVAFPTETVYGLGASVRQPQAVKRVFTMKGRPPDRALIIHVASTRALDAFALDVPDWARTLAERFWPGPLTLVVPRAAVVPLEVTGGGETVGLRAPDHPRTLALLEALAEVEGGEPGIAGPSANPTGAPPPTSAAAVATGFAGREDQPDAIVDGGACTVGIESTVVLATGAMPKILRVGAVSAERIAEALGLEPEALADGGSAAVGSGTGAVRSFGAGADPLPPDLTDRDGVIARTAPAQLGAAECIVLGDEDDAFGRGLFDAIHQLRSRRDRVWIERAPAGGIAAAINARIDRLVRESSE